MHKTQCDARKLENFEETATVSRFVVNNYPMNKTKPIYQVEDKYRNDPKFSDRYAWANSADPDQTVPRGAVWSGSTLFAISSASFGLSTLW